MRSLPSRECGLKYVHISCYIQLVVTPFAGVWIEILISISPHRPLVSLPSRECGLKYLTEWDDGESPYVTPFAGVWIEMMFHYHPIFQIRVTPFAGVWIEIVSKGLKIAFIIVTPFAGVWIEIIEQTVAQAEEKSLPSRECGLKCCIPVRFHFYKSHSLRGSVD